MRTDSSPRRGLSIRAWLGLAALGVLVVFLIGNVLAQRSTRLAMQSASRIEQRFEPLARLARDLEDSVVAYGDAVAAFLKFTSEDNADAVAVAGAQLEVALAEYRDLARQAKLEGVPADFEAQLQALQKDGAALMAAHERRHRLIGSYWKALENLRRRITRAGAAGLDVEGNSVLARKSLAELARTAAALGDHVSVQFLEHSPRSAAAAAADEQAFRAVLRAWRPELRRSPGVAWLELLDEDFAALVGARRSVARLDGDFEPQRRAFTDAVVSLRRNVQVGLGQPAWQALAESARRAGATARQAERAIAAVSLVVLVMVLAVWAAAARGVTGPVRRLTEGTRRLAAGALSTRVPRGGVRELDELARAFNDMADRLAQSEAAVRSYQAELESRVEERTRQLHHLAHHDPLTELPNRRQLFACLEREIARARTSGLQLAVLFIDLDNFKTINDSLGHEFGDRVLREAGRRLERAAAGATFVGRMGGDEFTIVLTDVKSSDDVQSCVAAVVAGFQQALEVEHRELLVGVSIGVAVFPDHAQDVPALLRAADTALFRAKELGRNRWSTYSPELFTAASERFQTEQSLRRAIEAGELLLHYQPEVSLTTRETTVVEALLRWRLPSGRVATAGEFLEVAEHAGLMLDLSDWVLSHAAEAVRGWRRQGWSAARVAVNASAQQFFGGNFVAGVERLLRTADIEPECLEIELTETALQTGAVTVEALRELRRIGVAIALDDFGAGFSSFNSIERLPLTRVKLDRALVAGVDSNPRSAAIARSIVSLCRGFGLQVTAEGVERPTQLEFLAGCGDVHVQGYLVARPAPAERIVEIVRGTPAQLGLLGSPPPAGEQVDISSTGNLIALRPRRP